MNWLAHIFLSEENIDFQIGNYLADPLKCKAWDGASEDSKKAIKLHQIIDSYSDKHRLFIQSKNRLNKKGLLRAIVIDVIYDYLLTKHWDKYCNKDFDLFLYNFYLDAKMKLPTLPPNAKKPLERMIEFEILNKNKTLKEVYQTLLKIDNRLSSRLKKRDKASSYFENITINIKKIEDDFLLFFPELCLEVKKYIDTSKIKHWKI